MPVSVGDKVNFETLREAMFNGDVAHLECQLMSTGESAAMICAVNREPDQHFAFVPLAELVAGDPDTLLNPPLPDQ